MTSFPGPATERGGVPRDWHHIVEKNQDFKPEQRHNVDKGVPVARDPIHRRISDYAHGALSRGYAAEIAARGEL
jgi:hypothetical protein